ncbi:MULTISPECIES: hypothetical protein [Halobacteriovorax]|uniref:SRP54-type proteins GTP-binding domain-containing protein n=1 Tax=Halobacteriovorax vibrionivorans TaxID=2152716 RepID=A0ABY0IL04_9BACT|nr:MULTISPECIES: hypothetical protein [Halobacteriovorax]AYF43445.1 hypothetical protein BALOs_0433 [Halobacteriovorax sp. BALOs_7]RZF21982.1 hypothetical protein DAY19_09865 [Halobacteriovorax vibrionivorans]TGD46463.1 hypothetical protein EP118_12050 [Halobacteriovorax sp. Y22]
MYVRKFEADSLDEALANIKAELGPDAIILKTQTNKGIKGAFKKKKIEITAAISEKNYTKKAQVDSVLNPEQKDSFYQNNSSYIANMINSHDQHKQNQGTNENPMAGYGSLGLNKSVNSLEEKSTSNSASGLDDFLSSIDREEVKKATANADSENFNDFLNGDFSLDDEIEVEEPKVAQARPAMQDNYVTGPSTPSINNEEVNHLIDSQRNKIDDLEKKIYELTQSVQGMTKPQALGVKEMVTIFRSLDIEERYIQKIVRKANFDLSDDDKENPDTVFEFALKEMMGEVKTAMPLFSSVDNEASKTVTVLISDATCGQSSMLTKLSALKDDSVIIRNKGKVGYKDNTSFSEKFFNVESNVCETISEIVAQTRKSIETKKNVFIDYKATNQEINEIKKFVDGLRRSFENVEVLICLSGINTELYNRKVLNRYANIANGLVVTHLDQCLNYGSLFNLAIDFNSLPYKFFGTGEIVPDDLEAATAERILAGIFKL